jgi:two-component system response regulator FlrC
VALESDALLFRDPAMQHTVGLAEQVAPSDASVLITGESGTGKEVLARFIHRKSRRAKQGFISVNCAAIPETLLESELFGHEKGSFTGAIARHIGKFEEANGSTLLLDEISEMHPRLQAKLLRAVQEREIDRVGGMQPVRIDIRLITISNRDLEAEVRTGSFREDLFFRLNVVHLRVPALRERPQDIEPLAEHFIRKYAETNGRPFRPLAPEVRERLLRHPWRGNVRELENSMHRAVLLARGPTIGPESVMLSSLSPGEGVAGNAASAGELGLVGRTVADVERDLILETLSHCLGNRTLAASVLGISVRTLRNKLQQYRQEGVSVPLPREPERASA